LLFVPYSCSNRVVNTLKDYAVKALVNTVDHLGSVSFKVNGLLDEKVDEVSGTELRVSCIEQVITWLFPSRLILRIWEVRALTLDINLC